MAERDTPEPMRLTCEPGMARWGELIEPSGTDRSGLWGVIDENAERLGTGVVDGGTSGLIATGHQAFLWHPGILAKDIASAVTARRLGWARFHVVLDHDVHDALMLELPVVRDGRLSVEPVQLAPTLPSVPAGCQPAVEVELIRSSLAAAQERFGDGLAVGVDGIARALECFPECRTLAEQVAVLVDRLRRPLVGETPVLFARQLAGPEWFRDLVAEMVEDARRCVECYNRAVAAHPRAGVAALRVEAGRVELPLWWLTWGGARQRVFVDVTSSGGGLVSQAGNPIDLDRERAGLAPKALLLTALLRRWCCDLFVHGHGGGVYDKVMETWWQEWRHERISPAVVVSADVRMGFDAPVSDAAGLARAVWWAHHLPHNIDRAVGRGQLDERVVARKRVLLDEMGQDRDRVRRAGVYEELKRINAELAGAHVGLLAEAKDQVMRARLGLENRAAAGKRDWCFALYPESDMRKLCEGLGQGGQE